MHETPITAAPRAAQAAWAAIAQAMEAALDPFGMVTPVLHAQSAWLSHPRELAGAVTRAASDVTALQWHTGMRMLGVKTAHPVKPHADDARFGDPVWEESAWWDALKESYLLLTHHVADALYHTPGMSAKEQRRAAYWWREWLNAAAPTNALWTNPVALRKAVETGGASLAHGLHNFWDDVAAGTVRMTGLADFAVGRNLATTPGQVIYRNRLLEVIRYTPTMAQVYETPIVIVTPWINKFYVLDLTPRKSLVRFLLDQGYAVYITSWKNPGADMRDVTFDDYLTEGIARIVDVARETSGARRVHAVGYCIGGAALATYMAWANRRYAAAAMPVASATLLATLVDYEEPGDIEVFLDEGSVSYLARAMRRTGYLDGREMASAFRLLRSNTLIWQYVVHGYLYGEKPMPFDVLYWNMDTTRMPAAMHEWYLRSFYLDNALVRPDALTVAGEKIALEAIAQPLYAVGAQDDHIAPWRSTFRVNRHVSGRRRFVLSSSGHILGIVNPVVLPPKREYWVADAERHQDAATWRAGAEHRAGSWWEDWMRWLQPQSGRKVPAVKPDTGRYPPLGDAPGTYVLER